MGLFDGVSWEHPLGDAGDKAQKGVREVDKKIGLKNPFDTHQGIYDSLTKGTGTWGGAPGEKGSQGAVRAALGLVSPSLAGLTDQPMFQGAGDTIDRFGGGKGAIGRLTGVGEPGAQTPEYEDFQPQAFDQKNYQTFDNTALSKDMQRRNAERAAQGQASALAQMNKLGTLSSSQANSAIGNLEAQKEAAGQGIEAQLGKMSFDDAMRQWMFQQQQGSEAVNQRNRNNQMKYQGQHEKEAQDENLLGTLGGAALGAFPLKVKK